MTGWKPRKRLASILLLCSATLVLAEEQQDADTPDVDEAFLLFLADWDDGQGHWQDPLEYQDPKWSELDRRQVSDDE